MERVIILSNVDRGHRNRVNLLISNNGIDDSFNELLPKQSSTIAIGRFELLHKVIVYFIHLYVIRLLTWGGGMSGVALYIITIIISLTISYIIIRISETNRLGLLKYLY